MCDLVLFFSFLCICIEQARQGMELSLINKVLQPFAYATRIHKGVTVGIPSGLHLGRGSLNSNTCRGN
jgi:phosphoglycerate-specific signal transduction histidine kinase